MADFNKFIALEMQSTAAAQFVSHWGKSSLRNPPKYWPFILRMCFSDDTSRDPNCRDYLCATVPNVECQFVGIEFLNGSRLFIKVTHSGEIIGYEFNSYFEKDFGKISSWIEEYFNKHRSISLPIFMENICSSFFEMFEEHNSDLSDIKWDSGCDLLLYLVCSNAKFAGIHAHLKPLPEVSRFSKDLMSKSRIQQYELISEQIDQIRNGLAIDVVNPEFKNWLKLFSVKMLGIQENDTIVSSDCVTDYEFKIEQLPDPIFADLCKKHGKIKAFHGSPTENWYSILRNGLQNRSWTKEMKSGAIFGSGIYLSTDLSLSRMFSKIRHGWNACPLGSCLEIVGVYEVVNDPARVFMSRKERNNSDEKREIPDKYVLVEDSNLIRLHSILVWKKKHSSCTKIFRNMMYLALLLAFVWAIVQVPTQSTFLRKLRRYYLRYW
jgi:hypothetical protein